MDPDIAKIADLALVALLTGAGAIALWGAVRWINLRTSRSLRHNDRAPIGDDRLARLESAVDAIAVEVERIGESQRFTAKIMAERAQNQLPPTGSK